MRRGDSLNGARDELLAGARLAGDQHRGVAVGHPADHVDGLADRRAVPRDPVDRIALDDGPQVLQLAQEQEVGERAADRDRERIELDRLEDEVVGTRADRADRVVERTLPGDHDRQDVGVARPDLLAELRPVVSDMQMS